MSVLSVGLTISSYRGHVVCLSFGILGGSHRVMIESNRTEEFQHK